MVGLGVINQQRKGPSDIIALEFHWTYNRVSAPVTNGTGAEVSLADVTAYPVSGDPSAGFELVVAGDEASVTGLIVQGPPIRALAAAGESKGKYAILMRGPACVRPSGLPDKDVAGDAFDKAAILAALAALDLPIIAVDETVEMTFIP